MRSSSSAYTTDFYVVRRLLERAPTAAWPAVAENRRIYVYLFVKTFLLSALITLICLLIGFPVAHLLATLPMAKANLLMILVLLPFWTSLLVRTTSWIVLLQGRGWSTTPWSGLGADR
jgi:putative spermidine/putrescine transport system permease protein